MSDARLIIHSPGEADREIKLSGQQSIGRAFDNSIRVEEKRVSRYHAVIEERAGDFWLNDLGTVNGTSVNDDPIISERKLKDGDRISIGGAITLEFRSAVAAQQPPPTEAATASHPSVNHPPAPAVAARPSGQSLRMIIGVAVALALVSAVALLLIKATGSESGQGAVRILSPASGAVISEPFAVRVKVDDPNSVLRIIYQLDGIEFATSESPPEYEALLDPLALKQKFSNLDGPRNLSVIVEDKEGRRKSLAETVLISFDLNQENESGIAVPGNSSTDSTGSVIDIDLRSKAEDIAYKMSKQRGFLFTPAFISEIEKRKTDYLGVSMDKSRYNEIERAFATVQGLPPKLGAIMAMSLINKLKQDPDMTSGSGHTIQRVELFWIPKDIALQRGCIEKGDESKLRTPAESFECASSYMKALWGQLEDESDFMYAIAGYGMKLDDAGTLSNRLRDYAPNARKDFLTMVKSGIVSPEGADRVYRFFAAAIFCKYP